MKLSFLLLYQTETERHTQAVYDGRTLPIQCTKAKNGGYLLHFFGESFSLELKALYFKVWQHPSHNGVTAYFDTLKELRQWLSAELNLIYEPDDMRREAAHLVGRTKLRKDVINALTKGLRPFDKDLVSLCEIRTAFNSHPKRLLSVRTLGDILYSQGGRSLGQIWTGKSRSSLWAIKNVDFWQNQTGRDAGVYYKKS